MPADKLIELEQRLAIMQRQLDGKSGELARVQFDLRAVQQHQSRRTSVLRFPILLGLSTIALILAVALPPQSRAQDPTLNTVFKTPVLFQNASGQTILEISDRPKYHGITLYGPAGEVAFFGVSKLQNGILQLKGQDGKLFASVTTDGFKFYGPSGAASAFLGVDGVGNGALQLKNAADGVVVDAGVVGTAKGFVQAYPRSGKSPFPIPNYIIGSGSK